MGKTSRNYHDPKVEKDYSRKDQDGNSLDQAYSPLWPLSEMNRGWKLLVYSRIINDLDKDPFPVEFFAVSDRVVPTFENILQNKPPLNPTPTNLLRFLPEKHRRRKQWFEQMFSAELADECKVVHNTNSKNCNTVFFTEER